MKTLPTSHRPYLPWIWLNRLKNRTADAEMLLVFTPKISRRYDKAFWHNRFSGKVISIFLMIFYWFGEQLLWAYVRVAWIGEVSVLYETLEEVFKKSIEGFQNLQIVSVYLKKDNSIRTQFRMFRSCEYIWRLCSESHIGIGAACSTGGWEIMATVCPQNYFGGRWSPPPPILARQKTS